MQVIISKYKREKRKGDFFGLHNLCDRERSHILDLFSSSLFPPFVEICLLATDCRNLVGRSKWAWDFQQSCTRIFHVVLE